MITGLILCLSPANERRRYFVTTSLIGWAQAYNQPCDLLCATYRCWAISRNSADWIFFSQNCLIAIKFTNIFFLWSSDIFQNGRRDRAKSRGALSVVRTLRHQHRAAKRIFANPLYCKVASICLAYLLLKTQSCNTWVESRILMAVG